LATAPALYWCRGNYIKWAQNPLIIRLLAAARQFGRFWNEADIGPHLASVANDPNVWSGRALQVDFVELAVSGLASMYPAFDWSVFAPGHHGYQRACVLISGQASTGPFGSPVFACAGKTEPPSLLILSQTSAGKACRSDYVIASSSRAVCDRRCRMSIRPAER